MNTIFFSGKTTIRCLFLMAMPWVTISDSNHSLVAIAFENPESWNNTDNTTTFYYSSSGSENCDVDGDDTSCTMNGSMCAPGETVVLESQCLTACDSTYKCVLTIYSDSTKSTDTEIGYIKIKTTSSGSVTTTATSTWTLVDDGSEDKSSCGISACGNSKIKKAYIEPTS